MIQEIQLIATLPQVFAGMENDQPVCSSQVWLNEVTLRRPDYYMIEAESGTGKSSLCSYIYGSRGDYSGRILFDGEDIAAFSIEHWCRIRTRALAYLPQEMQLFPELTALENIQIKNRLTGCKTDRWITQALERLEIGGKADQPAGKLSVGQQQRVAIARALVSKPAIVLADEPTGNLDSRTSADVLGLLQRTSREFNQTLVMITHNDAIAQLADRIVRIEDGKIVG